MHIDTPMVGYLDYVQTLYITSEQRLKRLKDVIIRRIFGGIHGCYY